MKRSTLVLLGIVVVLALVIFLWEKKQPSTGQIEKDADKLFASFPEKVDKIERTGSDPVVLQKARRLAVKEPYRRPGRQLLR